MDANAIQGTDATPSGAAPATESKEVTDYSVKYEKGVRLDAKTWESVEKGQQTEHNRAVNAALLDHLHRLDGHGVAERNAPTYATICDALYTTLLAHTDVKGQSAPPIQAPPAPSKGNAGSPPKRSRWSAIRTRYALTHPGRRSTRPARRLPSPCGREAGPLKRFLHSPLYEVRGLTLMWYARRLTADGTAAMANELDVAIQKFLEPGRGRSYIDPGTLVLPEAAAAKLLASVRLGAAAPVCTEAANMEAAFRAALDL